MNAVDDAIAGRRSVRAFLPTPVPEAVVRHVLTVAARAPSGTNAQPWKVRALAGAAKERLSRAILARRRAEAEDRAGPRPPPEYVYTLRAWREPYTARRRKVGWDLYGLVGVMRGDRAAARRQHDRNFRFFDAPVGLVFTIDRDLEKGSWLDLGMFIQAVMIAARAQGLETCPQAAFMDYHWIVRDALGISDDEVVVCGMSLGHEDPSKPENTLRTEREPVEGFAHFEGFETVSETHGARS